MPYRPFNRSRRLIDRIILRGDYEFIEALMVCLVVAGMLVGLVVLSSCGRGGRITMDLPDGSAVRVDQPPKAVAPATISRGADGTMRLSTGATQEQTPAMIAADQTWLAWIVGPALILIGIGALAAKRWVPLIPTTTGTYTIAAGAAVMTLAIGLPSLPTWVWILIAVGLGAWLILPGLMANLQSQKKGTQP